MSRTGKKYFLPEFRKLIWKGFLEEAKKAKSGEDIDGLLNKFFTDNERSTFEKRLGILRLLKAGKSYRQISRTMDVSLKTICFVKSGWKYAPGIKRKTSKWPIALSANKKTLHASQHIKGKGGGSFWIIYSSARLLARVDCAPF